MNSKNINIFFFGWLIGVTVFIGYQYFSPDIYVIRKYGLETIYQYGYENGTLSTLKVVSNKLDNSTINMNEELNEKQKKDSIIFNHIIEK